MLSIIAYLSVFLLVFAGGGHGPRRFSPWRPGNSASLAMAQDTPDDSQENLPIKYVITPNIVLGVLDRYGAMLQNQVIRANYQLRSTDGLQGSTPFVGSFGEWWARRRFEDEPEKWIDGTLVTELMDTMKTIVNRRVPDLMDVLPGWNYKPTQEIPPYYNDFLYQHSLGNITEDSDFWNGDESHLMMRQNVVSGLYMRAMNAMELMEVAAGAQQDVFGEALRAIDRVISRARDLAGALDVLEEVGPELNSRAWAERPAAGDDLRNAGGYLAKTWTTWRNPLAAMQRSWTQEQRENFEHGNIMLVAINSIARFLEDDAGKDGIEGNSLEAVFQPLERAFGITSDNIEPTVDAIIAGAESQFERRRTGSMTPAETYRERLRLAETVRDLHTMMHARRFATDVTWAASNLTKDLESVRQWRAAEADRATRDAEVFAALSSAGQVPVADGTDAETGETREVRLVYDMSTVSPRMLARAVRRRANLLEHARVSVTRCEFSLAMLNICESGSGGRGQRGVPMTDGERRDTLLRTFKRDVECRECGEPESCDTIANPFILRDVCRKSYYHDGRRKRTTTAKNNGSGDGERLATGQGQVVGEENQPDPVKQRGQQEESPPAVAEQQEALFVIEEDQQGEPIVIEADEQDEEVVFTAAEQS
ncbi:hypothetical protein AAE478_004939 [Parahypoxylon ruwenzoriense]